MSLLTLRSFIVVASASFLISCGGGGSSGGGSGSSGPSAGLGRANDTSDNYDAFAGGFPGVTAVPYSNDSMLSCESVVATPVGSTITGQINYQRVPLAVGGLNYPATLNAPVRGVIVEAVDGSGGVCSSAVVATGLTDGNGDYGLNVAANQKVCVRVRAQMYRDGSQAGPSWNVQVTDNTQNNAAYYLLDNAASTPAADPIRNLLASSGWTGNSYTQSRSAASFAILDSACHAFATFLEADNNLQFPRLFFRWSENNNLAEGNLSEGDVGGAFYSLTHLISSGTVIDRSNEIFLLGDQNVDTDEYDPHVITHELGHFFMSNFSRSDSFGGSHSLYDKLDMTVAFSEGWGDAFSGVALTRAPLSHVPSPKTYQDNSGFQQSAVFDFALDEHPPSNSSASESIGWYSESSVFKIFYNVFDSENDAIDQLSLPFSAIYNALLELPDSESSISIYSFIDALKQNNSASVSAIDALVLAEQIEVVVDEYGSNESLDANGAYMMSKPDVLPVYTALLQGVSAGVCSNPQFGRGNKLSIIQYLRFDAPFSGNYTITVTPFSGSTGEGKPAAEIYKVGSFVDGYYVEESGELQFQSQLSSGRHILQVYDDDNVKDDSLNTGRRCFTVRID